MQDSEEAKNPEESQVVNEPEESLPVGIARIREEWREAGLTDDGSADAEPEQVVFSEIDGGAGIGDYTLEYEAVVDSLGLAPEAVDRLISSGELDSILVQGAGEEPRRMVSESSFERFRQDSAMDPEAMQRAARAMADQTLVSAIDQLRQEVDELRGAQSKMLQQMKDVLLLELRNLKEQDRDLTSFVYELSEELKSLMPKKKRT